MLFRLVSNLQSSCLCCFKKKRLLDVMKSSGSLCSALTLWFHSGTFFQKLYFFLHVLLKCFHLKVILCLPSNNVLLYCSKSLLFLCKDKVCVNTDTIVLELWPHPHTMYFIPESHSLFNLRVLPLLFPVCHQLSLSFLSCWVQTSGFPWSSERLANCGFILIPINKTRLPLVSCKCFLSSSDEVVFSLRRLKLSRLDTY